jgi:exopolysaccharide production protein ExoZ
MNTSGNKEIVGIQAARYVAAMAVVVDHYLINLCKMGTLPQDWLPFAYRLGTLGVCVFFAISGFVMVSSKRTAFQQSGAPLDFLVRRVLRIWPMYALATALVFAMKGGADDAYGSANFLKSLAFIPYAGADGLYRPVLGQGWTLDYEMFFYGVFAACLVFPRRSGLLIVAIVLVLLAASDGIEVGTPWQFYTDHIVLYFLVGVALGAMVGATDMRWPHARSAAAAGLASAALFCGLVLAGAPSGISGIPLLDGAIDLAGVFTCVYLVSFADSTFRRPRANATAARLGDASYCIYLFHGFVLGASKLALVRLPAAQQLAFLPVACAAATVACLLLHLYVEKPLNRSLAAGYRNLRARIGGPALPSGSGT